MKVAALWLLATALVVGAPIAASAQVPCVAAGFDQPLATAEDVMTRYADVPAARFPGLWQEGRIRDYIYLPALSRSQRRGGEPASNDRLAGGCDL